MFKLGTFAKCSFSAWLLLIAGVLALGLPSAGYCDEKKEDKKEEKKEEGDKKEVAPGTPVTITVQPAAPSTPNVSLTLRARHGHATPIRSGCTHTAGGNVDVQQPSGDTVVITLTGAALAYCSPKGCSSAVLAHDLEQCFEVVFDNPKVKKAKLSIEGRVIGLLRSHCKCGTAAYDNATASVTCGSGSLLAFSVEPHSVSGGENISINDRGEPVEAVVFPGKYTLRQTFTVSAMAGKSLLPLKSPSSEFAPDAIDPLWLSTKEPFRGAAKKDFGFQITLKISGEPEAEEGKQKAAHPAPAPNGNGGVIIPSPLPTATTPSPLPAGTVISPVPVKPATPAVPVTTAPGLIISGGR